MRCKKLFKGLFLCVLGIAMSFLGAWIATYGYINVPWEPRVALWYEPLVCIWGNIIKFCGVGIFIWQIIGGFLSHA